MNDGGAPAAELFVGEVVGDHVRMTREQGVHCAPQVADAFSVNDPHLENALLATGFEVISDEILHFFRPEGMEVEHAVDGELDGIGHTAGMYRRKTSNIQHPVD